MNDPFPEERIALHRHSPAPSRGLVSLLETGRRKLELLRATLQHEATSRDADRQARWKALVDTVLIDLPMGLWAHANVESPPDAFDADTTSFVLTVQMPNAAPIRTDYDWVDDRWARVEAGIGEWIIPTYHLVPYAMGGPAVEESPEFRAVAELDLALAMAEESWQARGELLAQVPTTPPPDVGTTLLELLQRFVRDEIQGAFSGEHDRV